LAALTQLFDDPSPDGAYRPADSGVDADHPMRKVTRQVAFEQAWSPERAGKVADLFDSMASEWDEPRSGPLRIAPMRDAIARGGLDVGGLWLELGAGTGVGTRIFAPAVEAGGGRIVSVDLALQMLRNSPQRVAPMAQADAGRLPFGAGRFDVVALVNMLLFPDEVDRVLAPSGQVLWVNTVGDRTPIHLSPEDLLRALPGEWSATWARSGSGFWVVATRDGQA
jgi:SAM-dependent methyltransferase